MQACNISLDRSNLLFYRLNDSKISILISSIRNVLTPIPYYNAQCSDSCRMCRALMLEEQLSEVKRSHEDEVRQMRQTHREDRQQLERDCREKVEQIRDQLAQFHYYYYYYSLNNLTQDSF